MYIPMILPHERGVHPVGRHSHDENFQTVPPASENQAVRPLRQRTQIPFILVDLSSGNLTYLWKIPHYSGFTH